MAKKPSTYQRLRTVGKSVWDESWFRSDGELTRFYKFIHFWVLVIKSFIRNRCPVRASALSYTTLLALVPILAVAMSMTTSILKKQGRAPIEQFINRLVASVMPPSPEEAGETPTNAVPTAGWAIDTNLVAGADVLSTNAVNAAIAASISNASVSNQIAGTPAGATNATGGMDIVDTRLSAAQKKVADQIYRFIENIQGEAIAGVSMLLLVYAAIRMFSQIESTFNDIWGVTKGRSWPIRIVLYWAVISLVPILLAGVFGLTSGPYLKATQSLVA